MQSILSKNQKKLLSILSKQKIVTDNFYLTGGTALAEFYLHHRLSEDLDFFSENEFEPQAISSLFKEIKKVADIEKVSYEQSFNRNLFFLELKNDSIKTEFTYFPFPRIDLKQKLDDLSIDSLLDIAVNKVFTIYQKPRSRDFIDLYYILQAEKEWTIDGLAEKAQIKFDTFIDSLQLASQFVKVGDLKDYPNMIIDMDEKAWQSFFMNEAKRISSKDVK
ncbi:MAG: nucleotidyl transferase AbiEii/AbiGii toxin family protein [Patescibacteria group bacterium]